PGLKVLCELSLAPAVHAPARPLHRGRHVRQPISRFFQAVRFPRSRMVKSWCAVTHVTLRGGMASLERRVAIDAARAAGQLLTRELPASRRIAYKGGVTNLVTEMDARTEELIVGRLSATFPDDGILAEERGAIVGRSGRRWIIDPLDG